MQKELQKKKDGNCKMVSSPFLAMKRLFSKHFETLIFFDLFVVGEVVVLTALRKIQVLFLAERLFEDNVHQTGSMKLSSMEKWQDPKMTT